jgi:hypothetical protein
MRCSPRSRKQKSPNENMQPIKYWTTDPTIEQLTRKWGDNFERLPLCSRLNLIAALARGEWPTHAATGDALLVWMELDYLDLPARMGLIMGICAAI